MCDIKLKKYHEQIPKKAFTSKKVSLRYSRFANLDGNDGRADVSYTNDVLLRILTMSPAIRWGSMNSTEIDL